jgi:hypothetical protein
VLTFCLSGRRFWLPTDPYLIILPPGAEIGASQESASPLYPDDEVDITTMGVALLRKGLIRSSGQVTDLVQLSQRQNLGSESAVRSCRRKGQQQLLLNKLLTTTEGIIGAGHFITLTDADTLVQTKEIYTCLHF